MKNAIRNSRGKYTIIPLVIFLETFISEFGLILFYYKSNLGLFLFFVGAISLIITYVAILRANKYAKKTRKTLFYILIVSGILGLGIIFLLSYFIAFGATFRLGP